MKPTEYVKNVLVTEARDFTPLQERFSTIRNIRLLHGAIGLSSELAEIREMADHLYIDTTNLKEEMGDLCWYMGTMVDELGLDPDIVFADASWLDVSMRELSGMRGKKAVNVCVNNMTKSIGLATNVLKKSVMYGKDLDVSKLEEYLIELGQEVSILLQLFEMTTAQARELNISKLRARYGEKFTEAAALDRNIEAERKVLESK